MTRPKRPRQYSPGQSCSTKAVGRNYDTVSPKEAAETYVDTDPINIPVTKVTGDATVTESSSAYLALVDVDTDVGSYQVLMARTGCSILDTRVGTIDIVVPKLRSGSYFPEWLLERHKRAEAAVITGVADCYLVEVSTRWMDKLVKTFGINNPSKSQVSRLVADLVARGLGGVKLVT